MKTFYSILLRVRKDFSLTGQSRAVSSFMLLRGLA